jgi:dTDP-4-dehydrorhamnose reductase
MKTALFTGSEGQFGQAFVYRLEHFSYQIVGFDVGDHSNTDITT